MRVNHGPPTSKFVGVSGLKLGWTLVVDHREWWTLKLDRLESRVHQGQPKVHPDQSGKVAPKIFGFFWLQMVTNSKRVKNLKKNGTGEGTRTPTLVKEADFESAASTNSATPAPGRVS